MHDIEATEAIQIQEIEVLKSIYADDFTEVVASNVWKGATKLHEFTIKVFHPDERYASGVFLTIHTRFPKTYPALSTPTFTIQPPLKGITNEQVADMMHLVTEEAKRNKGSETVFQVITALQDHLTAYLTPRTPLPESSAPSLAVEMNTRALQEELARREQQAEIEAEAMRKAAESAAELEAQVQADRVHQQLRRRRANSNATEVPMGPGGGAEGTDGERVREMGDTPTETFDTEMEVRGVRFRTVKMFHPRNEFLGTTYLADPVCDDVHATLPLELFLVTFSDPYYATSQGRKKLKALQTSLLPLTYPMSTMRHNNVLAIYAVKLTLTMATAGHTGPSQLAILSEERPGLRLDEVLRVFGGGMGEERASDYLAQILAGVNAIHAADIIHRGISPRCIYLCPRPQSSKMTLKLGRTAYFTRLIDLHRSNSFGFGVAPVNGGSSSPGMSGIAASVDEVDRSIPDGWQLKEVVESPLTYTRARDLHAVGIVFLRMLMGYDVTERYSDVNEALRASSMSPHLHQHATSMLLPNKKHPPSCLSILADLAETSFHGTSRASSTAMISSPLHRSPTIPFSAGAFAMEFRDLKTPLASAFSRSPEVDYHFPVRTPVPRRKRASRWKEDFEELELLGKGAFGSVVKARNKIDSRIYAVKKVRLRTNDADNKIFREVEALSGLSHRFIVRYYTTWVESADPASTATSDDSNSDDSGTEDGLTSVPDSDSTSTSNIRPNGSSDDFDEMTNNLHLGEFSDGGMSRSSFPSIHFERSSSPIPDEEESEEDEDLGLFAPGVPFNRDTRYTPPPTVPRTLYIQMEFVERQTLKERIEEGITEDEAWRLFQQILDALVHMSTLGILHRDIKLTNIFIDAKGDCKVGDFGLATSSLAAVDPSDLSPNVVVPNADLTLEVGTRLYIAPEVMHSKKRGPRNHTKADLYSLGIVFFEMNHPFSTLTERIAVLEDVRKPSITFPPTWPPLLNRQREIITMLLQHEPDDRPTALELSQSPLLPPRLEDEYFKGALRMMAKPDSPHYQAVLSALFTQPPRPARSVLYDVETEPPEHASLNNIVNERLAAIFRLHGAVDMEASLLLPLTGLEDRKNQAIFLDRHGEIVALPINAFQPFARLASKGNIRRIKRYHIGDIYKSNSLAGHPRYSKAAVFDIITPDLEAGPSAAGAECIAIANDCLTSFPTLSQAYDVHVSHARLVAIALERIPASLRNDVIDILNQTKSSVSQKRAHLLKKGLLRSTADELELLTDADEDVDALMARLEKVSPSLATAILPAVEEMKTTIQYARFAGVTRPIVFFPLMLGSRSLFKDGVLIEVVRRNKNHDVLAAGGRYDHLITRHGAPKPNTEHVCAFGIQLAVEKITLALAVYQSTSVKTLVREQRSFGFWSPRRCDVYVVSYHAGHLQERLEIVSHLWHHGISADIMYESGIPDADHESHVDLCVREGILFAVYPPRAKNARGEKTMFKVKSILKGTEYELSRPELVGWLHHQIGEQKRTDASTAGSAIATDGTTPVIPSKEVSATASNLTLLLPMETKKQRKPVKQMFYERAFEASGEIKAQFQAGMPMLALELAPAVFNAMVKSSAWITEDEPWKAILAAFPPQQSGYGQQVRELVAKRRSEGHAYVLLYAVKEERAQLLSLV